VGVVVVVVASRSLFNGIYEWMERKRMCANGGFNLIFNIDWTGLVGWNILGDGLGLDWIGYPFPVYICFYDHE
jgi:hypothetical protein